MNLLVTSASGHNGSGLGKIFAFDPQGKLIGPFSDDDRIADPRGLGIEPSERLLASGVGPDGIGDDAIFAFASTGLAKLPWKVDDPKLSPLDLLVAPNGNILVSSEKPFGSPDAITSVREVVAFNFETGQCVGVAVEFPDLYGQALIFYPD
jgi:hypothetical protein